MPRHRLAWLFLRGERFGDVLHVAPEPVIVAKLEPRARRYVSADLESGRAMVEADLTALPFEDAAFDLVLCSHVLEHVPDDRAALRELRRVLRPGGLAVIQTPVNHDQPVTYEDASVTDPEERLSRFSQPDHVRVYGPDLLARLRDAGFGVSVVDAVDWPPDQIARYGLFPRWRSLRNELFVCR